jgi:hypothetical protein
MTSANGYWSDQITMTFEQHRSVKSHKQKAARIRDPKIQEYFKTVSPARRKAVWWCEAQLSS